MITVFPPVRSDRPADIVERAFGGGAAPPKSSSPVVGRCYLVGVVVLLP